jgi:hypothetical protein
MKHFVLIALLTAALGGYSQKPAPAVITRFYQLTGAIDKYPVTFLLHRVNEEFSGTYYYHSSGTPLDIAGKIDKDGFLKLIYLADDEANNETIQGTFKDSVFSGSWQSKGKMLTMRVSQPKEAPPISFDYIWTHGAKKITNKEPHLSHIEEYSYDGRTVWPKAGSTHPATQVVQQVIREMLGEKDSNDEPGKIMLAHKNQHLYPKDAEEDYMYEVSEAVELVFADNRLLVLSASTFSYSGGAHGNYGTTYENIDLQLNRKLTLNNVMDTLAAKKTVEKLLVKAYLKKFPLDEDEKISDRLLVEHISPTENFMLSGKGIYFNYVPYEIAAYAYGQIILYIPYTEIKSYLQPGFKKLMEL